MTARRKKALYELSMFVSWFVFYNLWDDRAHATVRFHLLKQSFDAAVFAIDVGTKQVMIF